MLEFLEVSRYSSKENFFQVKRNFIYRQQSIYINKTVNSNPNCGVVICLDMQTHYVLKIL